MRAVQRQPISLLDSWPTPDTDAVHQALREELRRFDRKVVVLDDDPTGVQTVHDVSVYTDWTEETFRAGLESNDRLFFVLTNSRSFSAGETTRVHREIAEHLAAASQKTGVPFVLISRSDSTLRGHFPLETETLRTELEALLPVLRKEIPLKAHAHRADDILTALRIAREFDLRITIEHCTEGHLIVEELKKANVPLAVGPTLTSASKQELIHKSWETPGILAAAGLQVSIITDASVIPQEYLAMCAGLAVKAGMDPFEALRAITINPARHLGVEDCVGSLEVGKDADIVLTEGDPLFSDSTVHMVLLNGKVVHEA